MKLYDLNVKYLGLLNGQEQLFQPSFDEFEDWIYQQRCLQFDIETNVTKHIRERKFITLQFGSCFKKRNEQWAFQWSYLTDYQKDFIKMVLESHRWEKLIQNAQYELTVGLNHDIRIRNVYDTLLTERVLWCGYSGVDQMNHELDSLVARRLGYDMIQGVWIRPGVIPAQVYKDEGANFGDNIITNSKLRYACLDVMFLDQIKKQQMLELHLNDLEFVAALENDSVIGFSQMMWEGMDLDKDQWRANIEWARPLVEEAELKLEKWLEQEPFRSRAIRLGYINTEDKVLINWKSSVQKTLICQRLFPGCSGGSKPILNKWILEQMRQPDYDIDRVDIAYHLMKGDPKPAEVCLLAQYKDWMIENELFRPASTAVINWNSPTQILPLLQCVAPWMRNMNADTMGKLAHPIGLDIEHFKEMKKLVDAYGEKFMEHVDPDGRVRTQFSQILVTGRVSSSKPNMQQIPAYEAVQTPGGGQRYRNCFKPPAGFKFVSSDYVSQELVIIAHITQDKNWLEAIRKKQDLHSMASELVFGSDKNPFHTSWKQAALGDCKYYKLIAGENGKMEYAKQKCSCPRHKVMRDACKSINFGLAYGMTKFRLAAMLRISIHEADTLIRDYFIAMPAIGKTMTYLGRYGMKHGFIKTLAPFFRKRWFPEWNERKKYIDEHIAGIRPDRVLGEIDKASKNQPIQGASADITKVAVCMVMWELDEKNLHDTVKLVLQVHDQLDTVGRDDFAEQWKPRLTEIMEEAAKVVIPSGLLKAETTITSVWSK